MRLLQMEEKYRSQLLYDQLKFFEDKVYLSYDQFNVETLFRMFQELTKRTVVDTRKIKSLAGLRKCHNDLKEVIKCKLLHKHVKTTPEEHKLVTYFTWFFQYIDYLRDLRDNFVDRIYCPLFRYFFKDSSEHEDPMTPTASAMSFRSHDSGYSGLSGLTIEQLDDEKLLAKSASANASYDEIQEARKRMVTKNALMMLGNEFTDIKRLYDTSEIEKLAERLTHLKERLDHLLDNEKVLNLEHFGQDSERPVFGLKIRDFGNEIIMRLVPDVLMKFQKCAWLARRWLERDDEKTKDLNAKLAKLTKLENDMNRRLNSLSKQIQLKEQELSTKSDLLSKLLEREERSNNLSQYLFDLQKQETEMQVKMRKLNDERKDLCERLAKAANKDDRKAYKRLRPLYDRNKLQRFALERQIATIRYHISISESDQNVELQVKSSLIHTTNDIQDTCEDLEKSIETARREKKAIQTALIPVSIDKAIVKERIEVKDCVTNEVFQSNSKKDKRDLAAEFVGTTPARDSVDLTQEFRHASLANNRQSVPFFITSIPDEDRNTPITRHLRTMDQAKQITKRSYPELVSSEW